MAQASKKENGLLGAARSPRAIHTPYPDRQGVYY